MRVGFTAIGGDNWTGGYHYLRNLLTALTLGHREAPVEPVVLCGPDVPAEMAATLAAMRGVEFHSEAALAGRRRNGRLARALIFGRDSELSAAFARHRLDVVFEAADFFGWRLGIPVLAWIPDFQHRTLPQQFSRLAYWRRELGFRVQIAAGRTIMLSSQDSMRICLSRYHVDRDRLALARFSVMTDSVPDAAAARAVATHYGLPEHFFYLPNQFWRHKNHLLVLEALALLRQWGLPIVVAASGRTLDPRHPDHFPALEGRIRELQISDQFRLLGMIPHPHLTGLMCASDAVLNPSLSEGWSTTVEEARSLGVPLLLSDLDVHKEQAGEGAVYFDRNDPGSLAAAMQAFRPLDREARREKAQRAHAEARARVQQFATEFVAAVRQSAAQKPGAPLAG